MRTHNLKILPAYFEMVLNGSKPFEIRKDDRDFCVGDLLVLKEWEPGGYTGRVVKRQTTIVFRDEEYLAPGFVILGLVPLASKKVVKIQAPADIFVEVLQTHG